MRNLGLDLLRLVAVLLVIVRHVHNSEENHLIFQLLEVGGWVGVDLFFVISGFLISFLLFKEFATTQTMNLGRFLIRRAFKIYPPFWLVTFFSVLMFGLTRQARPLSALIVELSFLQNYFPGVWLYTWSLAVEEHFYLGIAFVFSGLKQFRFSKSIKLVPLLCLSVLIYCCYLRYSETFGVTHYFYFMYAFKTHLRVDSLCFGVLLSYLVYFRGIGRNWGFLTSVFSIFLGLCLLIPAFIYPQEIHPWILIWGVILFYFGSGFLILGMIRFRSSKIKLLNYLGILGASSYSIYLWHMPIRAWIFPPFIRLTGISNPDLQVSCYTLLCLAVGWIMYLFVEKPTLWLRDQIYKEDQLPKKDSSLGFAPAVA